MLSNESLITAITTDDIARDYIRFFIIKKLTFLNENIYSKRAREENY